MLHTAPIAGYEYLMKLSRADLEARGCEGTCWTEKSVIKVSRVEEGVAYFKFIEGSPCAHAADHHRMSNPGFRFYFSARSEVETGA